MSGEYRRRWRGQRVKWLLLVLYTVLIFYLPSQVPWIVWGAIWLALFVYARSLRCPRCGKSFNGKGKYYNHFTRYCLNCGLPRGAPQDPDADGKRQGE